MEKLVVKNWYDQIMTIQEELGKLEKCTTTPDEKEAPVVSTEKQRYPSKIAGVVINVVEKFDFKTTLHLLKDVETVTEKHKKSFNQKPLFVVSQEVWDKGISSHPDLFDFRHITDEGEIVISNKHIPDYSNIETLSFLLGVIGIVVGITLLFSHPMWGLFTGLGALGQLVLLFGVCIERELRARKEFEKTVKRNVEFALPERRDYPRPKVRKNGATPHFETMKVSFINCPEYFQKSLINMKTLGYSPCIMAHRSTFSLGELRYMGKSTLDPTVYYKMSVENRAYVVGVSSFGDIPEEQKFIEGIKNAIAYSLRMN